ncbi:MAG: hypothetical protein U0575_12105 [Phycisphaerales bacterium]|jgi:hypothetical protein
MTRTDPFPTAPAPRTRARLATTAIDALHLLALSLWIATLVAVGAAAMGVFATLPRIGVELPRLAEYVQSLDATGDGGAAAHARQMGILAGGMVMRPIFHVAAWAELTLAAITVVTLACQLLFLRGRWTWHCNGNWLRAALLVSCAWLATLHALDRGPEMEDLLDRAWTSAQEGRFADANDARALFDEAHLRADRRFRARLFALLVALAVTGAASAPDPRSARTAA